ncbi:hypothetical protein [Xenorhabdus bharatensis]|uniref:hypothetical protein n=1 Tax=Xenorhabdus bharatensis TaxID=3136256 RepID=UPI0030F3F400
MTGGNAVAWYVQPEQNEQIGFKIFRAPNGEYDSSTFSYPAWEYKVYLGSDNNDPDRNGYIQAQPDDYQHAIVIYAVRLSIPNESILIGLHKQHIPL